MSMAVRRVLIGIIRYFYRVFRKRRGEAVFVYCECAFISLYRLLANPSRNLGLAAKGMNKLHGHYYFISLLSQLSCRASDGGDLWISSEVIVAATGHLARDVHGRILRIAIYLGLWSVIRFHSPQVCLIILITLKLIQLLFTSPKKNLKCLVIRLEGERMEKIKLFHIVFNQVFVFLSPLYLVSGPRGHDFVCKQSFNS